MITDLQLCVKQPGPRPWSSPRKGWIVHSRSQGELQPPVEEFNYPGLFFMTEGKLELDLVRMPPDASLRRPFRHIQLGGDPGADREHPGEIIVVFLWQEFLVNTGGRDFTGTVPLTQH